MHAVFTAAARAALLLAASVAPAAAAMVSYDDRAAFLSAAGGTATFDFTAQAAGTPVDAAFAGQGAVFTTGVFAADAGFSDGEGVTGGPAIEIVFDRFLSAIGFDYLGAITIVLYDAFREVGRSDDFGGPGEDGFGGVTVDEEKVKRVVIVPWYADVSADVDNMYVAPEADIPLPPAGAALGAGLLALLAARRRWG